MSTINALQKYTAAKEKVEDHIAANRAVFSAHEALVMSLIDAENEVHDEAAVEKASVSDGKNRVTVFPMTQEVFDEDNTLKALKLTKEQAISAGLIKVNERPPRITIGAVKE